jgi:catechol 2,3-dioxygenase-like lactoylglutathione lyase family enzyme
MSEKTAEALTNRTICQIGVVVRDVERAAANWADCLGLPTPEWTLTDPLEVANTVYQGEPTEARAKLAFFAFDNISLELIEPVGGPSTWQEFLDTHGQGVHHIAFRVADMDDEVALLKAKGMPPAQRGDYTGGCYSYTDSTEKLGVILELLANR